MLSFKSFYLIESFLLEGGNVFKSGDTDLTQRINKQDIPTTISKLEDITGLDFTLDKADDDLPKKWLGTTGRKDSSGDLDLFVDENEISKQELVDRLKIWCIEQGVSESDIMNTKTKKDGYIFLSGDNVHFRFPINGSDENGFVQVDFMFGDDLIWQEFSLAGGKPGSEFKGVHRNILLASLARGRGYKYSYKFGLVDPVSNTTIIFDNPTTNAVLGHGKDPNTIAKILLDSSATAKDLRYVENIYNYIKTNIPGDYEALTNQAEETFNKIYKVSLKSLDNSKSKLTEAVGRQYQHVEDMIIVEGSEGAIDVLTEMKNIVENSDEVTIKWDGSTAVYWGRDKSGNFLLLPQAQWRKKIITSKDELTQDIQYTGKKSASESDEDFMKKRKELSDMYVRLWDIFEKATPNTKDFIGTFFKGDIMFVGTPPKNAEGNYFFTPNKVKYVLTPNAFGGKIQKAKSMVTTHGIVNTIGDENLNPYDLKYVEQMDKTNDLIVVGTTFVKTNKVDSDKLSRQIDKVITNVRSNKNSIDSIANYSSPKMSNESFKTDLYTYSISHGKADGDLPFDEWLFTSKLTSSRKEEIKKVISEYPNDWKIFWDLYKQIYSIKLSVIDILDKSTNDGILGGVRFEVGSLPGGEGYVTKSGYKLINPNFRSAKGRF